MGSTDPDPFNITRPTSTPLYRSPQLRANTPPSSRSAPRPLTYREQPFLTYEDLHLSYSPYSPLPQMPRHGRVQRYLSAEDLRLRFQPQPVNPWIEGPNPPAIPTRSQSPPPPSTQSINQPTRLSTKLPVPPVFSGTNANVPFDDWHIRIQDKLTHNGDHYPSESFKVAYVMSRLGGEASKYITLKRRQDSYSSNELLDLLRDLYETPLSVIYENNYRSFKDLKQQKEQPFPAFYADFRRYSERGFKSGVSDQVAELKDRLSRRLRRPLIQQYKPDGWKMPEVREYLMDLDRYQRAEMEDLAQEKAQALAAQYARAEAEADAKRPNKHVMVPTRPSSGYETDEDIEVFRP